MIEPGARLTLRYAGGGGYGDPSERVREAVENDVRNGYISAEAAKKLYHLT